MTHKIVINQFLREEELRELHGEDCECPIHHTPEDAESENEDNV